MEPIAAFGTGGSTGYDDRRLLEAWETTPECRSGGWALVLRWGGREFHFNRFHFNRLIALRDTNRQDADSAPRIGTDTYRAALDLLPDEFLDFGSVGVGFEVTPVGIICRLSHGFVPSMGRS
jgi:hypothetical protein